MNVFSDESQQWLKAEKHIGFCLKNMFVLLPIKVFHGVNHCGKREKHNGFK